MKKKGSQKNAYRNQYIYGAYINDQLIFNKCADTIQWGKNCLFNKMLGQLGAHIQKNEIRFLPHTI